MLNKIKYYVLAFIILQSCSLDNNKEVNDVKIYIETNLNLELTKDHLYVIFSTQSCPSCIEEVVHNLNKSTKKSQITVILSGYSKKYFNSIIDKLDDKFKVVYDLKESKFAIQYLTSAKSIIFLNNTREVFKQFDYSELEEVLIILNTFQDQIAVKQFHVKCVFSFIFFSNN